MENNKNITVVGLGYVGLVTAVCFANMGYNVIGIDKEKKKIEKLNKNIIDFYEPYLNQILVKNKKRITFTCDCKLAYKNANYIFLCVQTPEKENGEADISHILEVINDITTIINHNSIIVIKSTVPVGTNQKIRNIIKKVKKNNINIDVASNPEFLSQGTAIENTIHPDRIIIGSDSILISNKIKELYKNLDTQFVITDSCSAEMIKYASNCFLAVKISYINEIANICEKIGANIEEVTNGMKMDKRIGEYFLEAGIGYGGSCFPKDTKALKFIAKQLNLDTNIIDATIKNNNKQNLILINKAKKYYDNFKNINIAVLGITFKPGTDDIRNSPAVKNLAFFLNEGANVKVYDPKGLDKIKERYKEVICCETIEETLSGADICFIFTEWKEIKNLDLNIFKKYMNKAIIIDGRNCYKLDNIKKYDLIYESIGRRIYHK